MHRSATRKGFFNGTTILITGGTGSWGNELVTQLLRDHNPKQIRIYSRGEHKQVEMKRRFKGEERLSYIIGDVRDKERLMTSMRGADYVFHLAALKHVPVCEENPWESVLTNIVGAQNVIDAAIECGVRKVIDISTDKAVDPYNIYGTCKAAGEKLMIAANRIDMPTRFVVIRGGNVLGTNGSVVPLFREQILRVGEVTITDPSMTRFMMNLEEAVSLIFEAAIESVGGEVFVMRMPALTVQDLAETMIKALDPFLSTQRLELETDGDVATMTRQSSMHKKPCGIRIIGIRPGEKMHELLVSRYEAQNMIEHGPYYIILPTIKLPEIEKRYAGKPRSSLGEFGSHNTDQLDSDGIRTMLEREGWLQPEGPQEGAETNLSAADLKNPFKAEGWTPRE